MGLMIGNYFSWNTWFQSLFSLRMPVTSAKIAKNFKYMFESIGTFLGKNC